MFSMTILAQANIEIWGMSTVNLTEYNEPRYNLYEPYHELDNLTPEQRIVIEALISEPVQYTEDAVVQYNSYNARSNTQDVTFRTTWQRGSFLSWVHHHFEWTVRIVNGGFGGRSIRSSQAWQTSGFTFPNIARATGVHRHNTSPQLHTYRATWMAGAGTPTPWGDIMVYEINDVDIIHLNNNGHSFR